MEKGISGRVNELQEDYMENIRASRELQAEVENQIREFNFLLENTQFDNSEGPNFHDHHEGMNQNGRNNNQRQGNNNGSNHFENTRINSRSSDNNNH